MAASGILGRHSSPAAAGAGPRLAWVAVIGAVVAAAKDAYTDTEGSCADVSADDAVDALEDSPSCTLSR